MASSDYSILLECLHMNTLAQKKDQLAHVAPEVWQAVAQAARPHAVEPLLHHILNQLKIKLPDEVAGGFQKAHQKNLVRNAHIYQGLHKVLTRMQQQDILVIVLKGAYLADTLYDNFALRPMGDVDLLVREADLLQVEQEMLALDFQPEDSNRIITSNNRHFAYKNRTSGLVVEVHWSIQPERHPFEIDVDGLWQRAQMVTLTRSPALALGAEDLLLHLCIHAAEHVRLLTLGMLYDIALAVVRFEDQIDWQILGERAQQWGTLRPVHLMLLLAQQTLQAPVPLFWLTEFQPEDFDQHYLLTAQEILSWRARNLESQLGSPLLGRLWSSKRLGEKLSRLYRGLLPDRRTLALDYPADPESLRIYLYYPALWRDYLAQYGWELWRLLRGDRKTRAAARRADQSLDLREWLVGR